MGEFPTDLSIPANAIPVNNLSIMDAKEDIIGKLNAIQRFLKNPEDVPDELYNYLGAYATEYSLQFFEYMTNVSIKKCEIVDHFFGDGIVIRRDLFGIPTDNEFTIAFRILVETPNEVWYTDLKYVTKYIVHNAKL